MKQFAFIFLILFSSAKLNAFRGTLNFLPVRINLCAGTPANSECPGSVWTGGAIFLGSLSPGATSGSGTDKYMTTPGGCGDVPNDGNRGGSSAANYYTTADFTPTCSGTDALTKTWNDGTANWYDIPGLTNYSTTGGTGNGAINTDQYYGSTNTTNIVTITAGGQGGYHAAARYCDKLSYGGYTDWHLPNRYELNLMYTNKTLIPGLQTTGNYYWASTEYGSSGAWIQRIADGLQSTTINKSNVNRVRCVRRFSYYSGDFTNVVGASLNMLTTSNTLTITGFTGASAISISGDGTPAYQIDGGSWTTLAGTISAGSTVTVRLTSSASISTTHTAILNIGGETKNWTVTTVNDPCLGSPTPGTVCTGGAIFLGSLSPGATSGSGTDKYMTTAGGCSDIPAGSISGGSGASSYANADFTPASCSGTDALTKTWNNGTGNWYDIPGLTNYISSANTDQYYGSTNTTNIVAITAGGQGGYHAAARYCDKLSWGGYTDWHLPNRAELNLMYTNKTLIPGLQTTGNYYWTSTEYSQSVAWYQRFSDGNLTINGKNGNYRVRCVRRY